jgi:hypothetical protein
VAETQNNGRQKALKCARNTKQWSPESTKMCQKHKMMVARKHRNVPETQNDVCQKALKCAINTKQWSPESTEICQEHKIMFARKH